MGVLRRFLVMSATIATAAGIAGTATASPGTAPAPAPVQTSGFIPDAGVSVITDPSKAHGRKTLTPTGYALCGTCGGGGNVQGCATVYVNNGDAYGNWVKSYYHWCWLNGAISSNYGWADEAACWGFCNFLAWNYTFDFTYGHQAKATFRDVSGGIFHIDSADAACVAVDGWGNAWGC
ncbi:MAG TPA: hypothetical protein VI408_08290 [Gaiellaceae bacterium]